MKFITKDLLQKIKQANRCIDFGHKKEVLTCVNLTFTQENTLKIVSTNSSIMYSSLCNFEGSSAGITANIKGDILLYALKQIKEPTLNIEYNKDNDAFIISSSNQTFTLKNDIKEEYPTTALMETLAHTEQSILKIGRSAVLSVKQLKDILNTLDNKLTFKISIGANNKPILLAYKDNGSKYLVCPFKDN